MFSFSSIEEYHKDLLHGRTSCKEAVQYFLDNISSAQPLNAFLEVYGKEALDRADILDQQRRDDPKGIGRLHGVVVGLKDVITYKNHKLTAASRILEGYEAVYNATAVDRLLAEGAIVIGRQNCDEFAMGSSNENSAFGNVLNAKDHARVPGGSSGGSAVAVQADLCMVSLGSDTGGSVRQPADFCGIVGLKPTYGRISRYGLIAYASSFDQIGIFSRNVTDAARILEVIAGEDDFDSTVSDEPVKAYADHITQRVDKKYKIACLRPALEHPSLDAEIKTSITHTIEKLGSDGHSVEMVDFDYLDYIVPTYYILTTAEASSNLSRFDGVRYGHRTGDKDVDLNGFYKKSRSEGFGVEVQKRIMLGSFVLSAGYFDAYFTKAQKVRSLLKKATKEIFDQYDLLIMPTVTAPAFRFGEKSEDPLEMYLSDIYTVFANLVGIPAISLPLYQHSNGMPFGLQVLAPMFKEEELLRFSNQILLSTEKVLV
ncbi:MULTISPECIES: Asp-tRNA(Asn)/Glu-tRNA(Gln) amidotransferase subunit GatA [Chitinophagaceae]